MIVASLAPPPAADELIKYPSLLEFIVTFVPGSKEPLNTSVPPNKVSSVIEPPKVTDVPLIVIVLFEPNAEPSI